VKKKRQAADKSCMSRKGIFLLVLGILAFSLPATGETVDHSVPQDIRRDFDLLVSQLRINPNHVPTLNSIGILYARVGQIQEAINVWKRGLQIDPQYVHLYNNLGTALKSLRRFDEARKVFLRGLMLSQSYWIYHNLGLLEKEVGRPAEARNYFLACLKINPNFEPARNQIGELEKRQRPSTFTAYGDFCNNSEVLPKEPVNYYEAFGIPAPWELKEVPESDFEERTESHPTRPVPSRPITTEECFSILSKIPGNPNEKVVALTFDDGPHGELTPKLLDLLRSYGVIATFFVIGSRAEMYPDITARIAEEGHEIGNHTWNHRSLVNQSVDQALGSLRQTSEVIAGLTGKSCKLVRPPYGHTNYRIRSLLNSNGYYQIMWDVDTRDWKDSSPSGILTRILGKVHPGSIILFHDIHPGALRALPILIPAMKRAGFRFLTVSQLLGIIHAAS